MRPESVEIKVTVSEQVGQAVAALPLTGAKQWSIGFCEDVTDAVTPGTPLLDLGVILRVRRKSNTKGDSTVKLRPCRWSQLDAGYFANAEADGLELKIEADWAGPKHGLAAALTLTWDDDRFDQVRAGDRPAAALFGDGQRDFLERCARGRVNLAAISLLPALDATRWDPFDVPGDGAAGEPVSIRAERWTIPGGDDFLELSVVGAAESAPGTQAALERYAGDRGLAVDRSEENKTQRVLSHLAGL
jgi:hypothetical protein